MRCVDGQRPVASAGRIGGGTMEVTSSVARAVVCCGVAIVLSACTSAGKAKPAGFLRDYSQLTKSKSDDRAQLTYVNAHADFTKYRMILIEPVTVWDAGGEALPSRDQAQLLADDLDDSVRITLGQDYKIVNEPGPGVMRLRAALTESEASWHVRDNVASRFDKELSAAKPPPSDATRSFVGRAGVEAEMLDSATGERLLAAVDRRAGERRAVAAAKEWDDVHDIFELWSNRLRRRLAELRGAPVPLDL